MEFTAASAPESATTRRVPLVALVRALGAISCAVVVLAFTWQVWFGYHAQSAEWRRETQNLAESLSQQAEATLQTADSVTVGVRYLAEGNAVGPARVRILTGMMRARLEQDPALHGLYVIDARGNAMVATRRSGARPNRSYADREYFRYHATHRSRDVYIGLPIRSRTDGSYVLTVSRRIDNADGSFRGVAVTTLSLSYFVKLYRRFDFFPKAITTLMRDDGTIEARQPFASEFIGMNYAQPGSVFSHLRTTSHGVVVMRSVTDHVQRLTAFRHSAAMPVVTVVGVPIDDVFAAWRRASIVGGISSLIAIVAIIAATRVLLSEIRLREGAQAQLSNLAFVDGLTDVPNRRRFDAVMASEWTRGARERTAVCLLMIDVDRFKEYNDRYGHLAGDDVLRRVAATVTDNVRRPADLVARFGGEEFAVILPGTPLDAGAAIAETIRGAIAALALPHDRSDAAIVTVSIGVAATMPRLGGSSGDVIAAADAALYTAKAAGRNRVHAQPIGEASPFHVTVISEARSREAGRSG